MYKRQVGALPYGRNAWKPLADGVSPNGGTDVNGPGAVLKSVAHLPHARFVQGTLLNMKVEPEMLNSENGKMCIRDRISPWQYEHEDTTHFSVADAEGNMVSVTQTVNGLFGAKVIPEGYGFVLNNEMDDFSADAQSPNAIAGGKVPLSSMSPTIVLKEDGSPFMVLRCV